jgi:HEPN domain-containing protein
MNAVVREWIEKAEGDFATAGRELAVSAAANYDAVCFHAQQCIEKYLKALLIVKSVAPPRTHDLAQLGRMAERACAGWRWPVDELRLLTRASIAFRYPGESAEKEEAAAAFDICRRMRDRLVDLLA